MSRQHPPQGGTSSSAGPAERAGNAGRQAADSAEQAGQQALQSKPFKVLVTVGLIAYGIVHVLIGWIALQIAWTGITGSGENQEASQQGALNELAETTIGAVLLWVIAIGLIAMAIWQLIEAIWGHLDRKPGFKRIRKRLGSAGRTVAYTVLAVAAISTLQGDSGSSESEEGWTAKFLANPFGRIAVIAFAIAVIVVGVRLVRRGLKKKFTEDLAGGVSTGVVKLGQVGYVAKGIAYAIIGGLFGWAAITYDAEKAGGLDDALRTINEAPFGAVLLTAMALGLACFGVYCFFWARNPRLSTGDSAKAHG